MHKLVKIVSVLLVFLSTFSAYAAQEALNPKQLELLPGEKLELSRPLFDQNQITLQPMALSGNTDAEFETALRYYFGYVKRLDVPFYKSYSNAAVWFAKAAQKGHALSSYFLGNMYYHGQGVPQDAHRAMQYLGFARKEGINQATYTLAELSYTLYTQSDNLDFYKPDYLADAKSLYKTLADKGEPQAAYNLALIRMATEDNTRYLKQEASELLLSAVEGFSTKNDRETSLKALELMRKWDLKAEDQARSVFNQTFLANNGQGRLPRIGDDYR
jgi:TPR repeat protein